MVSKFLFIEGAKETDNGDLRKAFHVLLKKVCDGNMPRIIMSEGKKQTIDKFLNTVEKTPSFVKIDLDAPEEYRDHDLKAHGLTKHKAITHYMIQEMEAWFFSQPKILDEYYSSDFSSKIGGKKPLEIKNPDEELQKLAKNSKHKTRVGYHKVRDGSNLLEKLDANQLRKDFPDFENLIANLKKAE